MLLGHFLCFHNSKRTVLLLVFPHVMASALWHLQQPFKDWNRKKAFFHTMSDDANGQCRAARQHLDVIFKREWYRFVRLKAFNDIFFRLQHLLTDLIITETNDRENKRRKTAGHMAESSLVLANDTPWMFVCNHIVSNTEKNARVKFKLSEYFFSHWIGR